MTRQNSKWADYTSLKTTVRWLPAKGRRKVQTRRILRLTAALILLLLGRRVQISRSQVASTWELASFGGAGNFLNVQFGLTQPDAETGVDKWALWVGGTKLRGANIYQRRVYPELDGPTFMGPGPVGPPYTQEDFDRLAALGANYVNISHPGLFTETPPYTLDQDIQDNLDNLLAMIAQADMFAVISFRTGPGRSEFWAFWGEDTASDPEEGWFDPSYYNNRLWGDRAAQDAWVEMWRYTAQRYKDNPIVVGYDLMVEPNANEVLFDEWDPPAFYQAHGGSLADWNQLYPRIIEGLRLEDPLTPVLVQPMGYGAVDWLLFMTIVDDPHTIYAVHQYDPYVYTHQEPPLLLEYPGFFDADEDGEPEFVDRGWLDGLLETVDLFQRDHGVVVAVNEMGISRWEPGAARFISDEISLLEARGLAWAVWAWEPSYPPWAGDVTQFNFRLGPDPSNTEDVPGNELLEALVAGWASNTKRPGAPRRAEGRSGPG